MESRDDKKRYVMRLIKNRPSKVVEALRAHTAGWESEEEVSPS